MSALRLSYQVTTTRTPVLTAPGEEVGPPTTETSTVVVELADAWCSTREGAEETIVDASTSTWHRVDHEAGTVETQPIHALVAARKAEVASRLEVLQVLGAGGAAASSRADTEASLGIEASPPEDPGFVAPEGASGAWRRSDQTVAEHEPSEHWVAPATLRRWLAHAVMVHPRIAEAIAAAGKAPARLHHRVRLLTEVVERTWTLLSAEPLELDREARLADLEPAPPVDELHGRVRAMLAQPVAPQADRLSRGREALAQGRYLEALLSLLAHSLATTDHCAEEIQQLFAEAPTDDPAHRLLAALHSVEQGLNLTEAMKTYDRVEEEAGDLAHVVALLRSNALTGMASQEQDPERSALIARAREGFVRAIEADPGLAGVYKDLGDLYVARSQMGAAWDLWALGRRLAPGHRIFATVDAYEQHLHQAHPELY